MIKPYLFIIFFFCWLPLQAGSISGTIVENSRGSDIPVSGANIYLKGTILGSVSSQYGKFSIKNIPAGEYILTISIIGYELNQFPVKIQSDSELVLDTIHIKPVPLTSKPVVVTASRNRREIRDVPVSVSTISAKELDLRNAITIEDALKYLPGININASQVNIRGSNGYSRGVGSRVMMLLDGIPYLTGDTQETNLESLPIQQISHIEVVKGAGSALYGSNAMGGIINIITKNPADMPLINFKTYGGLYSDPYYKQWRWSDRTRYLYGMKLNVVKKWDDISLAVFAADDHDDNMKKNAWRDRYQAGGKLHWNLSPYQTLTLTGAYMDQKRGNFLYWKNLENALIPPDNQLNDHIHSRRFHLASTYRQILGDNSYYLLQGIWYRNHFKDNIEQGNNSISDFTDLEAQYTKELEKHIVTSGVSLSSSRVQANIFGNRMGEGMAVYIQDEYKYSDPLKATLGLRFDYASIDSLEKAYQLSPKAGIVYQPNKITALRFNAGTGYRAPSIAEAFTSTTAGGIRVVPNNNLKPEKSFSTEFGLNQILSQQAFFDAAIFYSTYHNLIEARFTPQQVAQFQNVTRAYITGFELLMHYEIWSKMIGITVSFSQMKPWDEEKQKYLSFRPKYLLYTNTHCNLGFLSIGIDYRYIGRYEQIDDLLASLIEDGTERVPVQVVDCRIQSNLRLSGIPLIIALQINNILQYNYTELIGTIAPTRQFILTLETSIY